MTRVRTLAYWFDDEMRPNFEFDIAGTPCELTLREGNRRALGLRMQQMQPGSDVGRLKALNLPTLILWGGNDRLIPPALAQRFAADIGGAKVIVFDGLGHVPQEEDPARTVQPLLEFLSGPA